MRNNGLTGGSLHHEALPSPMWLAVALWLAGCAASGDTSRAGPTPMADGNRFLALLPADAILFGEQHDAPQHHLIEQQAVEQLATRGRLAALALEMAEQGRSTATLSPDAKEDAVREALDWSEPAWPWAQYGPIVMAAVRAGVPVLGANLPRAQMRPAMADATLDSVLPANALAAQQNAIRDGHCQLLPEAQIAPMTRIQLARDRTMAHTIQSVLAPGRTVLLVAGGGHVRRDLGVPRHVAPNMKIKVVLAVADSVSSAPRNIASDNFAVAADADLLLRTAALPPRDPCESLR